jgi:hypothetical protein
MWQFSRGSYLWGEILTISDLSEHLQGVALGKPPMSSNATLKPNDASMAV